MIQNIINRIGVDKILHVLVSLVMMLEFRRFLPVWGALTVVLAIGIIKEIYDKVSGKGTPDWRDIVADCIGIVLGLI